MRTRIATTPDRRTNGDSGLTLYEVILSLIILLGALVALGQLISTGSRAAVDSKLHSEAVLHARTKMAELISGVQAIGAVNDEALGPDFPGWSYSVQTGEAMEGLLDVIVTVRYVRDDGRPAVEHDLRQFVRDPQLWYDAASAAEDSGGLIP